MNYEKKYKEALCRAKTFKERWDGLAVTDSELCLKEIKEIFPELKNEDEMVRNELIIHCRNTRCVTEEGAERIAKWIAWLEKQVPVDEDKIVKGIRRGVAISLMNHIDANSKEMCLSNMECEDIENAIIKEDWDKVYGYMKKKLEKHGEPIDKFEPKFHEGDWISGYYTNYRVTAINSKGYVVEDTDGNKINILFENEKFHHLFTIADAKDGDVLMSRAPFIYGKQCPYGGLNWFNNKFIKASNFIFTDSPVHPATKEQRDLLFQKMKEAGYMFDFEKKALKKLGQQCEVPVTINIDKMVMDYTNECGNDGFGKPLNCMIRAYRQGLTDAICTLTLANKKTTDKVEQEPTKWTPTDEQMEALRNLTGSVSYPGQWQILIELYNDLKKLTE